MIQRALIEEFLEELFEKAELTVSGRCAACGEEDDIVDFEIETPEKSIELILFIQDWLQEHKGEL